MHTILKNYSPEISAPDVLTAIETAEGLIASATDGPTTCVVLDDNGNVCRFLTTKRIEVVVRTVRRPNGKALGAIETLTLDMTTAVLMLSREQVIALESDGSAAFKLVCDTHNVQPCNFSPEWLASAICNFFCIEDLDDLTDDLLHAAIQAVLGGIVEETVTLSIAVKVRHAANVDVNSFIEDLDYSITSNTPGAKVLSTEITDAD